MTDPHLWWYVTRASTLVAWAAMTGSVLWGVLLATRVLRSIDNPAWLQDLHRWLGGTALIMTGLHMLSLMLDSWAHFSLTQVLVPLAAGYRPWPVALGIVAFYLLIAVYGSSLLRPRNTPAILEGAALRQLRVGGAGVLPRRLVRHRRGRLGLSAGGLRTAGSDHRGGARAGADIRRRRAAPAATTTRRAAAADDHHRDLPARPRRPRHRPVSARRE